MMLKFYLKQKMRLLINLLFGLTLLLQLSSCKKNSTINGYTYGANGFYYKLLAIGDGNENLISDNVIVADAQMCLLNDSVFWDTKHFNANEIYLALNDSLKLKPFYNQLLKLTEGDSVSYLLKPKLFFKLFFDTIVPQFCKTDTLVKINFKITQVISINEYKELKRLAQFGVKEDVELNELKLIACYLNAQQLLLKPNNYGIYQLSKTQTNNEQVSAGKKIKIQYQSTFLDGKPLDNGTQTLEFIYGTPDQLIKGLNIVIGTLKKGEISKIIVPSRLAFGEQGSSNGNVAPYTPIIYNITIIDIN